MKLTKNFTRLGIILSVIFTILNSCKKDNSLNPSKSLSQL